MTTQCANTANVEFRFYVGCKDGVDKNKTYYDHEFIRILGELRKELTFDHPIRITDTQFMTGDNVVEYGWEVSANLLPQRKPGSHGLGDMMQQLAQKVCIAMNQRKVIGVSNYETFEIINTSFKDVK